MKIKNLVFRCRYEKGVFKKGRRWGSSRGEETTSLKLSNLRKHFRKLFVKRTRNGQKSEISIIFLGVRFGGIIKVTTVDPIPPLLGSQENRKWWGPPNFLKPGRVKKRRRKKLTSVMNKLSCSRRAILISFKYTRCSGRGRGRVLFGGRVECATSGDISFVKREGFEGRQCAEAKRHSPGFRNTIGGGLETKSETFLLLCFTRAVV